MGIWISSSRPTGSMGFASMVPPWRWTMTKHAIILTPNSLGWPLRTKNGSKTFEVRSRSGQSASSRMRKMI